MSNIVYKVDAAEMAKADELGSKAAMDNEKCYSAYDTAWREWHSKWLKSDKEDRFANYNSYEEYYDESNTYWKEYAKWIWLYEQNPDLIAIDDQKFKEFEEYSKSPFGSRKHRIYSKQYNIESVKHHARLVIDYLKFLERMDRRFR